MNVYGFCVTTTKYEAAICIYQRVRGNFCRFHSVDNYLTNSVLLTRLPPSELGEALTDFTSKSVNCQVL